jgi:hypothetical protein
MADEKDSWLKATVQKWFPPAALGKTISGSLPGQPAPLTAEQRARRERERQEGEAALMKGKALKEALNKQPKR